MDFSMTAEQKELQQRVRRLAEERLAPLAPVADESSDLTPEVTQTLAEAGLFKYVIPQEYGGNGIQVMNVSIIREELSRVCDQADVTFAMQGLGSYPITLAGSPDLKQRYLPPVASGHWLASFALTEPGGGSDVVAMSTAARRDGDHWVLNGQKKFISQTGAAHFYSVFAKTDPERGARGISAFVVEKGMPGFDDSEKLDLLAPHCIGAPRFHDCRVPLGNLVGEENRGLRVALGTLDVFRTTVGASAVGLAQAAYEEALKYARRRQAFGQPLAEFQATQFKLAEMAMNLDAARLLVYRAAWLKDNGQERVIKEASFAKLFATELAQRVADEALQIHGGAGLVKGSVVERLYRLVRAPRIYEGTTEIQKQTIARELLREADEQGP